MLKLFLTVVSVTLRHFFWQFFRKEKQMRYLAFLLMVGIVMSISIIGAASETNLIPPMSCRAVYDADTPYIGVGNYVTAIKNNHASLTKEIICPIVIHNPGNADRDTIDSIAVNMDTTTGSSCQLYAYHDYGDSGSVYNPNNTYSGYFSFTTDRAILSSPTYLQFTMRCWIAPLKSIKSIGVVFK